MLAKIRNFLISIVFLSAGFVLLTGSASALQMPGYSLSSNSSSTGTVAPIVPAGSSTSYNWAGYVASSGTYTAVTGTWTVPTATANGNLSADATWVGIGGVTGQDLIQTGTQAITSNGGQMTYQAWYELLPDVSHTVSLSVKPGDSITATITEQSANTWLISLNDNTTGQSYSTTVQYNSSLSSAEWIEEMPAVSNGFVPLDNFGSVTFSNASAVKNGSSMDLTQLGATQMTMVNAQVQALATPSAVGSDGASFTVSRTSAAPTASVGFSSGLSGRGGRTRVGRGAQGFTRGSRWGYGTSGYQSTGSTTTSVPSSTSLPSGWQVTTGSNGQQIVTITIPGFSFSNFSFSRFGLLR